MKTQIYILTIIIFLLLKSQIAFSQWELTYTFNSYFDVVESDISFSNPQNGYVYYREYLSPSSGSNIYYAKTTDFGNTWNNVYEEDGWVSASEIFSTHQDTVFCFKNWEGISQIMYSYDSGNQWSLNGVDANYPGDMFFINGDIGYMITSGYNTNKLTKFTPESLITLINSDTINLDYSKIFFVNSQIGYLTAKNNSDNNILLFTNNGGNTWSINNTSTEYVFRDLFFTSDSIGYIACSSGKILKTIDFGINLTESTTPTVQDLNSIEFVNDSCGYCVGNNGVCIYSDDYGITWLNDPINTTDNLLKVQLFNINSGYILSSGNQLFSKNINNSIFTDNEQLLEIYPNPTSGYLYIKTDSKINTDNTFIYNIQGQEMLSKRIKDNQLDISNFNKGLYIIKIFIDNNLYINKIIKN